MRPMRISRRACGLMPALVLAIAGVAAVPAGAMASRTASAAAACPSVALIGAAGSGELAAAPTYHDLGAEVNRLATVLGSRLRARHRTLVRIADEYPAAPTSRLLPSKLDFTLSRGNPAVLVALWALRVRSYLRSIELGIEHAVTGARAEAASCPHTALVLAGYSQGAIAIHQAELRLAASPGDAGVLGRIAGTLLVADGDRIPLSHAKRFGTATAAGRGIRVWLHLIRRLDVPRPATTASICNADDIVCDFSLRREWNAAAHAVKVHTSYAVKRKDGSVSSYSPTLTDAARWLAAKL